MHILYAFILAGVVGLGVFMFRKSVKASDTVLARYNSQYLTAKPVVKPTVPAVPVIPFFPAINNVTDPIIKPIIKDIVDPIIHPVTPIDNLVKHDEQVFIADATLLSQKSENLVHAAEAETETATKVVVADVKEPAKIEAQIVTSIETEFRARS